MNLPADRSKLVFAHRGSRNPSGLGEALHIPVKKIGGTDTDVSVCADVGYKKVL